MAVSVAIRPHESLGAFGFAQDHIAFVLLARTLRLTMRAVLRDRRTISERDVGSVDGNLSRFATGGLPVPASLGCGLAAQLIRLALQVCGLDVQLDGGPHRLS